MCNYYFLQEVVKYFCVLILLFFGNNYGKLVALADQCKGLAVHRSIFIIYTHILAYGLYYMNGHVFNRLSQNGHTEYTMHFEC